MQELHTDIDRAGRELTDLERGYADSKLRQAALGMRVQMGVSALLVLMGIALPVALSMDSSSLDDEALPILAVFVLLTVVAGAWFFAIAWSRKFTLASQTCRVTGTLREEVTRVHNPRSGGSTTHYRYRVGDRVVLWPFGAEPIYKPLVDQVITIVGVTLGRSNPITLFGARSRMSEAREDLIVLEFDERIRIHHVLQKYGRHYFVHERIKTGIAGTLMAGAIAAPVWYFSGLRDPSELSVVRMIAVIALSIVVAVVLAMLGEILWRHLAKRLGLSKSAISHIDRLKG